MGVGKSTVDSWARNLRNERNGGISDATPISEESRRIRMLEREIQQLKQEKEILKKATALLMSDSLISSR